MSDHTDVHEFLRRMADETGLSSVDPAPIMRKARRRLARTAVIGFLAAIVLVAGALAGASTLTRSTIPAKQTLKNNGVISFIGDDEIDAIDPDGTGRRLLVSDPRCSDPPGCTIYQQEWSPDGTRIAFTPGHTGGYGGGFADIYVADADGTNTRRLVKGCDGCGPIAWSPDGSRIAFGSLDYSSEPWIGSVSVVNADGGGEQNLCTDCGVPAWSPDGTRLAVVIGNTLHTINPDGSDRRELTTSPSPRACSDFPCDQLVSQTAQPSWSPDGTRIAFLGTGGLYVVDADGTDSARIVDQSEGLGAPVWSPDGGWIAYMSTLPASPGVVQVHVTRADGTGNTALYSSDLAQGSFGPRGPVWSPDGGFIAFTLNGHVSVMDADGSGMRVLADRYGGVAWQPIP